MKNIIFHVEMYGKFYPMKVSISSQILNTHLPARSKRVKVTAGSGSSLLIDNKACDRLERELLAVEAVLRLRAPPHQAEHNSFPLLTCTSLNSTKQTKIKIPISQLFKYNYPSPST